MPDSGHEARLIIHNAAPGPWNMAVDQCLLESAAMTGNIAIRIYRWKSPTLSLGYFQNCQGRSGHTASQNCDLVRRASGGGAILHDLELTYSIAVPLSTLKPNTTQDLYKTAHQATVNVFEDMEISLDLHDLNDVKSDETPFLCFQRRSSGDLIMEGQKIGGSAQRRLQHALLQHGSLLMETSSFCPELPGIANLGNHHLSALHMTNEWIAKWPIMVAKSLDVELIPSGLTPVEQSRSKQIVTEKFGSVKWTEKR